MTTQQQEDVGKRSIWHFYVTSDHRSNAGGVQGGCTCRSMGILLLYGSYPKCVASIHLPGIYVVCLILSIHQSSVTMGLKACCLHFSLS